MDLSLTIQQRIPWVRATIPENLTPTGWEEKIARADSENGAAFSNVSELYLKISLGLQKGTEVTCPKFPPLLK